MSVERKIAIGLIVSDEYTRQVHTTLNVQLLKSQMAKRLASWCLEYWNKYKKAPGRDIEGIYLQKLKNGLPKDIAEEIEQDILPGLSEEYECEQFNVSYLLDQTHNYLNERHLDLHSDEIRAMLSEGKLIEAERLASNYKPLAKDSTAGLDLSSEDSLQHVAKAFSEASKPVVYYPKQLGAFWNAQLVRGAFVALMGPDKRGKSYWLLDMAVRGARQGAQVAMFQTGDMTESQQLRRLCIYLTKRSDRRRYCKKMYEPVRDCIRNQLNTCNREERTCDFGVFAGRNEKELHREIEMQELVKYYEENKDYTPCFNCDEYDMKSLGAVWITEINAVNPLTAKEAEKAIDNFFVKNKRRFKLSTHPGGTLTLKEMEALLDVWELQEGFVPDMIVIDFADHLHPGVRMEPRHQVNEVWKGLRNLSMKRHCLVVTATWSDAASYDVERLRRRHFSEDRRKLGHVTAMYGLNQDPHDREKEIGIMRINEIVVREGEYSSRNEVTVLQNLKRGRPFLGSYW